VDGVSPELPEDPDDPDDPDTPVEGPEGPAGPTGPAGDVYLTGAVTADDLSVAFARGKTVILQFAAGEVYGEVPAESTLIVVGKTTKVTDAQTLNVKGTLTIWGGGILNASGIAGSNGLVTLDGGTVGGDGMIAVPFNGTGTTYEGAAVLFGAGAGVTATKIAGSKITNVATTPITAATIGSGDIVTLFAATDELTLLDAALTAAIPANKKLTLVGPGNTVTANVSIPVGAVLTIAQGAKLSIAGTFVLNTTGSGEIRNKGEIVLTGTAYVQSNGGEGVYNDNIITSSATAANSITPLLALKGSGQVRLTAAVAAITTQINLYHDVVLVGPSGALTLNFTGSPIEFREGAKLTIESGATLTLGANTTGLAAKSIVNRGTIATPVILDNPLQSIFAAMDGGGAVTATGIITGTVDTDFTVPKGVILTTNTGASTFANTRDLIVEEGAALTISGAGNVKPAGKIWVKEGGTLEKAAVGGTLGSTGDFIVDGTFTNNGTAIVSSDAAFTVNGTFTNVANIGVTSTGLFTVDGTFTNAGTGVLTFTEGLVVGTDGTLDNQSTGTIGASGDVVIKGTLKTGGIFTILTGRTLTIASPSKVSGVGVIKSSAAGGTNLTIGEETGYLLSMGGIAANTLVTAIGDLTAARGLFTDSYTIPSYTQKVIGIVTFPVNGAAVSVKAAGDFSSVTPVALPASIAAVAPPLAGIPEALGTLDNGTQFSVTVSPALDAITVTDSVWVSGSSRTGIVTFAGAGLKLTYGGTGAVPAVVAITTPPLPGFSVGIQTVRAP
jgi:filamentous hemagglutinin